MTKFFTLFVLFLISTNLIAQTSITTSGASQNFDVMSTGTALPANWKISTPGRGGAVAWADGTNVTATTLVANSGTPTTGGSYNWGTTGGSDRAVGFMNTSLYTPGNVILAHFRNTTGRTLTAITVSYQVERYRINTSPASVSAFSSTDGTNWVAESDGSIFTGVITTGPSAYTFANPTTITKTFTISGLNIANNGNFYLSWIFSNSDVNNSQGLGLDNVTLSVPFLTANLGDNLVDANSSGTANPGETIIYRDTVKNTGTEAATGVTLTNPAPTGSTYTANSLSTSALARDDSYSAGTTSGNVLSNDYGLKDGVANLKVVTYGTTASNGSTINAGSAGTTDAGGSVTVNADGTFSYTPPANFTGFDKFKYIATTEVLGLPNNDAIVTITVGTPATAVADAYNVIGNVSINPSGSFSLLANDGGTNTGITAVNGNASLVGVATTTANGGNLTVNANGSFTYNPAPGFTGSDNFSYTVDNGLSSPATATATLTVSGMVWFVNNTASTNGDGRLSSPFQLTTNFQDLNTGATNQPKDNDNVFFFESATTYGGSLVLRNGQKLIGQDASASLASITGLTPNANYSAQFPAMNTSGNMVTFAGNVSLITLGSGNTIRGVTLGASVGNSKVSGVNFGTLTLGDATAPDVILSGDGRALNLSTGTLAGGLTSLTTTSSSAQGINLNAVAGTYNFGNTAISGTTTQGILISGSSSIVPTFGTTTVIAGTDGVSIQNNSGNVTFSSLGISTVNGVGLLGSENTGQIVVTNAAAAINATGGAAISLSKTTGTSSVNLNFSGLTSSGTASNGVTLTNISGTINGGTGSLTSTGTVFNISGGNATINYGGSLTKSSAGRLVDIINRTGNNITLSGALSSTGSSTGINVSGSTGGGIIEFSNSSKTFNTGTSNAVTLATNGTTTINFTGGGLGITTTSGIGISATGSGIINVSGTSNSISSTTGTALNLSGITVGATGMAFSSVSANGAANGVSFTNVVGTSGSGITINGGTITGGAGAAFNISGGSAPITYTGNINQATASQPILSVAGGHTGSLTLTGVLNATNGTGLQFNKADGTYNFNGTTTLSNSVGGATAQASLNIINGSGGTFSFGIHTSITNPNDTAFNIWGGTAAVTYNGNITQPNNFPMVSVSQGHTTGTVTFPTGTLQATNGTGLQFDNADGTYQFNGTTTSLNGGDAGIDIINGSNGNFTFNSNTSITNPSGTAFNINGGTGNVTYNGTITDDVGLMVAITNTTGGTKSFTGAITDNNDGDGTEQGVSLTNNTGATITFSGGLIIRTTSNPAFTATGGGTVNATQNNSSIINTLTSTTGTALNVSNTTIGSSGVTFRSISANGATRGIVVKNTGTNGAFSITGDGVTANSGGTIQNTTGPGGAAPGHPSGQNGVGAVELSNTNFSLKFMRIFAPLGNGFQLVDITGSNTIEKCVVDYNSTTIANAMALRWESYGTTTDVALTLDATTFQNKRDGSTAISVSTLGSSSNGSKLSFTVKDSNTGDAFHSKFTNLFGSGIVVGAGDMTGVSPYVSVNISNTQFVNAWPIDASNNPTTGGLNDLYIGIAANAICDVQITDNLFDDIDRPLATAGVITINTNDLGRLGSPNNPAIISGNTIQNIGVTTSVGTGGYFGIRFAPQSSSVITHRIKILNNQLLNMKNKGIFVDSRDKAIVNAEITGNIVGTVAAPVGQNNRNAMDIIASDNTTMNILVQNNSIVGQGTSTANSALSLTSGTANNTVNPTSKLFATITGNTIKNTSSTAAAGTTARFRARSIAPSSPNTNTSAICLVLTNNILEDNTKLFELTHASSGSFSINATGTGVAGNTGTISVISGSISSGISSCSQPSFARLMTTDLKNFNTVTVENKKPIFVPDGRKYGGNEIISE
jgi:hypothetical protein